MVAGVKELPGIELPTPTDKDTSSLGTYHGSQERGSKLWPYTRGSYPKGLCGRKKGPNRGGESSEAQGAKAEYKNKGKIFFHMKENAKHAEGMGARS